MADSARISSIESLPEFRAAIWKFAETAQVSLGDAESDLSRTLHWLEGEQTSYWSGQIRKRKEIVTQCADKFREKRLFKDASGRVPSAVDEEKALRIAQRRLEEAEEKLIAVRKYIRLLQKAVHDYKGSVQGLTSAVAHDLPVAVAKLDRLSGLLRQYVELAPAGPADEGPAAASASGQPMGRLAGTPAQADAAADESLPDFPHFDAPAVVLVQTHTRTGLVLASDGKTPAEAGNQYQLFVTLDDAQAYAERRIELDAALECAIYGADGKRLALIVAGDLKV